MGLKIFENVVFQNLWRFAKSKWSFHGVW